MEQACLMFKIKFSELAEERIAELDPKETGLRAIIRKAIFMMPSYERPAPGEVLHTIPIEWQGQTKYIAIEADDKGNFIVESIAEYSIS